MDAPYEVLATERRAARFWSNVERVAPEECWPWLRAVNGSGYGVVRVGDGGTSYTTMAHRVAAILTAGAALEERAVVDHLCRVRACCNPAHLEVVTPSTNVRRTSRYRAGEAEVVRRGPSTIRPRGDRFMLIWREYLSDGKVRQAGQTFDTHEEALTCQHMTRPEPAQTGPSHAQSERKTGF